MHGLFEMFQRRPVAVIGDLILDTYIYGDVSRISAEAPVPIVRARSEKHVAGGAANVAVNLSTLGAAVRLVGLTGRDEAAEQLKGSMLMFGNIDCSGVIASARDTTRKMRIVSGHQQMMRIDREEIVPCHEDEMERFKGAASDAIGVADVVVLSDYGKGVFSDIFLRYCIDAARSAGKMVIVDPKRKDFSGYRGATIITPNRKELTDATGVTCDDDASAARAAAVAQEASKANILLTRSESGMSYFPLDGTPLHIPTVAQDVFDVSGAGDTVVAAIAACFAGGMLVADAMRIANHAAGIVVSKLGTATATCEEIQASILAEQSLPDLAEGELVDWETAARLRWGWAKDNLTVGVANGCFDLLHAGHVWMISQAAGSCDRLIVAINSNASVKRLKGPSRPIQDEKERAAVIGALRKVAAVVVYGEDTPLKLIEALQPDLLVKGSDYAESEVVGADIVKARGGRVLLVEVSPGHSTTRLIQKANPNRGSTTAS